MDNTNKNNNMWMFWIVGVFVLIGIVALVMGTKSDEVALVDDIDTQTAIDTNDQLAPPEGIEDTTEGSVNVAFSPAVTLSYQQALVKYADRRIQFDTTCAASPKQMTYKDNTGIMLDNRSPETRTIKVGSTYTVKGYGFKIITLPDISKQPRTILIDCDRQQNVATILVQE